MRSSQLPPLPQFVASAQSFPEQVLELALQSGAQAAEVYQSQSRSRPVFFEANRLKQLESSQAIGTALRLWRDGRPGLAVAYGPFEAATLVDRALALATLNAPEEIELGEGQPTVYPDLGEAVSVEQLIDWGKGAIATIRNAYPEVLCSAEWECEVETTRLINSRGLDCGYSDTTLGCYLSAEWIRGDDFLCVADGQTERGRLDADRLAAHILQRLDWVAQNATAHTGKFPVLFTAKAADMLWGTIQAALNGKQVLEGASPWGGSAGGLQGSRLGDRVLSPLLTLGQRPADGPYSSPFDDEGTPTHNLVLVQEGNLQGFYCDRRTGRQLGLGSTGNGIRPGLGSYPAPGLFNFVVTPGEGSLGDLIAELDEGLVIDQVMGGGGGISGEFSINVDLGYWVSKGEIAGRVKDTMVTGNVYNALKAVARLGGDAEWNGSCCTPSIVLESLSVTGRSA